MLPFVTVYITTICKCASLYHLTSYAYARTVSVINFMYHTFRLDFILCATTLGFSMEPILCAVTLGFSMERILEYMTVLCYVRHVYFTIMCVHRVISVREFREYKYADAQYTEAQYTETGNPLQYTVNNTKCTCFWLIGYTLLTVVQYMLCDSKSRLIPLITSPKDNVSLTCTYGE